ncbi:hypothetical protein K438DRAFT_1765439 [Mycena galopus ATCC 62051]|nr:hypothetical protein K438DRAFT_1765439 [Mycena galopus ATCC 62051]
MGVDPRKRRNDVDSRHMTEPYHRAKRRDAMVQGADTGLHKQKEGVVAVTRAASRATSLMTWPVFGCSDLPPPRVTINSIFGALHSSAIARVLLKLWARKPDLTNATFAPNAASKSESVLVERARVADERMSLRLAWNVSSACWTHASRQDTPYEMLQLLKTFPIRLTDWHENPGEARKSQGQQNGRLPGKTLAVGTDELNFWVLAY